VHKRQEKSIDEIVADLTLIQHPVVVALVGIYQNEVALLRIVPNMKAALGEEPDRFDISPSMANLINGLEEYHKRQEKWVFSLEQSLRELHTISAAAIWLAKLRRDWARKEESSSGN
jgi:hypothetical protein